jgi:hypothetical protein
LGAEPAEDTVTERLIVPPLSMIELGDTVTVVLVAIGVTVTLVLPFETAKFTSPL